MPHVRMVGECVVSLLLPTMFCDAARRVSVRSCPHFVFANENVFHFSRDHGWIAGGSVEVRQSTSRSNVFSFVTSVTPYERRVGT